MVEWKRLTAITGNPVDVYMDQVAFIEQYVAVDPRRAPRTGCRDHAAELRLLWNFPLKRSVGLALRSLVPIMLRYRQERSASHTRDLKSRQPQFHRHFWVTGDALHAFLSALHAF